MPSERAVEEAALRTPTRAHGRGSVGARITPRSRGLLRTKDSDDSYVASSGVMSAPRVRQRHSPSATSNSSAAASTEAGGDDHLATPAKRTADAVAHEDSADRKDDAAAATPKSGSKRPDIDDYLTPSAKRVRKPMFASPKEESDWDEESRKWQQSFKQYIADIDSVEL